MLESKRNAPIGIYSNISGPSKMTKSNLEKVLDLSEKHLKKLEKRDGVGFHCLILDNNEISKLENLDRFPDLEKLSACRNRLSRMYGVAKLHHLVHLDLSNNAIVWIEGLKELVQLSVLNLSGNSIKCIQNLQHCVNLTQLDLSKNIVPALTDLSFLTKLQTLNLDGNKITSLKNASMFLPHSLCSLSLADNCITDLNEVSYLYGLPCLEQLAIANNPCILMTGQLQGFDYRPFVVNWCLGIRLLDGFVVTQKESLKAEWLYSQGKGRHFQPGEHVELVEYLAQVCPLTNADQMVVEEEERLTRILRMQRQHREELLYQMSNSPKEQRKWIQQQQKQQQQQRELQSSDDSLPSNTNLQEKGDSRIILNTSLENTFLPIPDAMQKNETLSISNELAQSDNKANSNKHDRPIVTTSAKSPVIIEQIPTKEMLKTCFQSYEDRIIRPNHNIEMVKSINSISPSYLTNSSNTTPVRKVSIRRSNTHSPSSPATGRRSRTPRAQWKSRVSSSRGASPQDTDNRRTLHVRHNSESDTSEECGWSYKAIGNQSPFRQRKQLSEKNSRHSNCTASLRHSYSQTPIHSDTSKSKTASTVNHNCNENRKNINRILQNGSLIPSPCNSPILSSRASRSPIKKSISDNVICVTQQQEKLNALKLKRMEKAVVKIQSVWRGYHARHYNPTVFGAQQEIRLRRMEDSINFLHSIVLKQQEELQQEKELRRLQAADITKLHVQLEQIQESLMEISEIRQQNLIMKEMKDLQNNPLKIVESKSGHEDSKSKQILLEEKETVIHAETQISNQQTNKTKSSLSPTIASPTRMSPVDSPGEVKTVRSSINLVHCGDICVPIASESDTDSGWQSMIGSFGGDGQSFENGFHLVDPAKDDSVNGPGGMSSLCITQRIINNCSNTKLVHDGIVKYGITNDDNLINSIGENVCTSPLIQDEVSNCVLLKNKDKSICNSDNNETYKDNSILSNKNSLSIHESISQLKLSSDNAKSAIEFSIPGKMVASDSLCSTPESSCTVIVQAAKDDIVSSVNDKKGEILIQKSCSPEKNKKDKVGSDTQSVISQGDILAVSSDSNMKTEMCNSSVIYRYRSNETITDDEKTAELPRLAQLNEYNSRVQNNNTLIGTNILSEEDKKINATTQEKNLLSKELSQQKVNSSSRSSLSSAATVWETRVHNIEATLQQLQLQFKELEGTIGQILLSPDSIDLTGEPE